MVVSEVGSGGKSLFDRGNAPISSSTHVTGFKSLAIFSRGLESLDAIGTGNADEKKMSRD